MPSGQVSIWVPIVVAVLGIVGIVSGQLINAWREDRRWRRELEREDIRWEREYKKDEWRLTVEKKREGARYAHEARIEWRLQRFEIYKQFANAVDFIWISQSSWIANFLRRASPFNELTMDLDELPVRAADIDTALIAVEFVAGDAVLNPARKLQELSIRTTYFLGESIVLRRKGGEDDRKIGDRIDDEIRERLQDLRNYFDQLRTEFMNAVKLELALALELPQESSGPS